MIALHKIPRLVRLFADKRRGREVVREMPVRLWVESTSYCNLRCEMCPNKDMPACEKAHMELPLFKKIVDEAASFVNDMYLHHRGEPFLNVAIFDMITYAREAGIRTRFHTNGMLMDETKAEALLDAEPELVSFSIDGFEKAAYEKIRAGAVFETTVANVLKLAELKKARGQKHPYIVVERIRFRDPEIVEDPAVIKELEQRFLSAGVDEVIAKDEYVWAEDSAPELEGGKTCGVCTFPWYAMVICADGTVTPCPQDFWANMKMGDAKVESLAEIWNGPAYRDLRRRFGGDLASLSLCRKCDRLQRPTVGGVPFQYLVTFLVDQLAGYGRLRKLFGTSERNS